MKLNTDPLQPALRWGLISVSCFSLLGLSSCVVPVYPDGPPPPMVATGSVGYYNTLPPAYVGDAYFYQGRYYYGGSLQVGTYFYNGRRYSNRYYHNGHYYYGGRQQYYGPHGGHGDYRHYYHH